MGDAVGAIGKAAVDLRSGAALLSDDRSTTVFDLPGTLVGGGRSCVAGVDTMRLGGAASGFAIDPMPGRGGRGGGFIVEYFIGTAREVPSTPFWGLAGMTGRSSAVNGGIFLCLGSG